MPDGEVCFVLGNSCRKHLAAVCGGSELDCDRYFMPDLLQRAMFLCKWMVVAVLVIGYGGCGTEASGKTRAHGVTASLRAS